MVYTLNFFTGDIIKDPNLKRLNESLPGIHDIIFNQLQDTKDETNVLGIVREIQTQVIVQNKDKIRLKNMFQEAIKERFLEAEQLTIKMLEKFSDYKDKVFNSIEGTSLSQKNESDLKKLENGLDKLNDELLQVELDMYQSINDQQEIFSKDLKEIYTKIEQIGKSE